MGRMSDSPGLAGFPPEDPPNALVCKSRHMPATIGLELLATLFNIIFSEPLLTFSPVQFVDHYVDINILRCGRAAQFVLFLHKSSP